jgi:beta-N-acetylhexosaminidase
MDLKAITEKYSIQDSAIQAINAGADILLYRNIDSSKIAIEALKEAAKKRSIKKELFVEKMLRIERCKKEHFSTYEPIYIPKITDAFNPNKSKVILDQFKMSKSKG